MLLLISSAPRLGITHSPVCQSSLSPEANLGRPPASGLSHLRTARILPTNAHTRLRARETIRVRGGTSK